MICHILLEFRSWGHSYRRNLVIWRVHLIYSWVGFAVTCLCNFEYCIRLAVLPCVRLFLNSCLLIDQWCNYKRGRGLHEKVNFHLCSTYNNLVIGLWVCHQFVSVHSGARREQDFVGQLHWSWFGFSNHKMWYHAVNTEPIFFHFCTCEHASKTHVTENK